MEKNDPNLLPVANGRTFEQILQEEYNGNLSALVTACDINGSIQSLYSFLNGQCSAAFCLTLLREIACAFGEEIEVLFPPELYRQPIYSSMQESPGYRLLAERFQLQFHDRKGKSLFSLLKNNGFTKSDHCAFCHALMGLMDTTSIPILLKRIATKLNISEEDLFPPAIYAACAPSREPCEDHTVPLHNSAETWSAMQKATYPPEFVILERQEELQIFLAKVLELFTEAQRQTNIAHFLDGNGRTLAETAKALGYNDRRVVDEHIRTARERILRTSPELIEEWKELQTNCK